MKNIDTEEGEAAAKGCAFLFFILPMFAFIGTLIGFGVGESWKETGLGAAGGLIVAIFYVEVHDYFDRRRKAKRVSS